MAKTPTYPEEAAVGDADPEKAKSTAGDAPSGQADSARTRKIVTGAAIGIGSAALVAALLYTNRSRKGRGRRP